MAMLLMRKRYPRLESLATHSIDVATIPLDAAPIEEDAWTLAPSPTRARIGTTGLESADSVVQDSSGKQVNFRHQGNRRQNGL